MIKMTTGEAVIIFLTCFKNVESGSIAPNLYMPEEIAAAVYMVANMETHNGIAKEAVINALRWILENWVAETEEKDPE